MIPRWIKNIFTIHKELDDIKLNNQAFIQDIKDELNKYKVIDADFGYRGNSSIILTGVFRGKAYVQFYDVDQREFEHIVMRFKDMRKNSPLLRNVDAPHSFKAAFDI